MGSITLRGVEFLFDDEDQHIVDAHSWWLSSHGYAYTKVRRPDGSRRCILMHRVILGDPPTPAIDHINRIRSDNRRCNLRACSDSTNNRNRPTLKNKASRHRGVSRGRNGRWQVVIRVDGKLVWLGSYQDEDRAGSVAAPYFAGIAP